MLTFTTTLSAYWRDTRYLAGACLLIPFLYISCGRPLAEPRPVTSTSGEGQELTPKERELTKRIADVAAVLHAVYQDSEALAEVNAAIASGYYRDERVLLADLLYPGQSPLYEFMQKKQAETVVANSTVGVFAKRFKTIAPGILSRERAGAILASAKRQPLTRSGGKGEAAGNPISIYQPYSENFGPEARPLVVPATVEADTVYLPDPACRQAHLHGGADCTKIRVDESYVEKHPVHIIGTGALPATNEGDTYVLSERRLPEEVQSQDSSVRLIYLGIVRCSKQYDRLISFTGNGGGSELKFIRGEAYVTLNNNQQVVDTEFDIISVDFRRKDIRKEREKYVYAIWDSNWAPEKAAQVFGIYEEDTRGEREFSGSVDTEIEHPGGTTTITPVEYSYVVESQDEIIRQIDWDRTSFFTYNRSGLAGCGHRDGYSWYDCHLPVAYSLPAY